MGHSLDYAAPATPGGGRGPFLTPRLRAGVTPRFAESSERCAIGPDRPTARAVVERVALAAAGLTLLLVLVWLSSRPGFNHAMSALILLALAITAMIAASEWTSRRRTLAMSDWLTLDRSSGAIALPTRGETLPASSVARIEYVDQFDGQRLEAEIRLVVVGSAPRVGIVCADARELRPIAVALARVLAVPLDELSMRGPGRALAFRTTVDGARVRLTAMPRD